MYLHAYIGLLAISLLFLPVRSTSPVRNSLTLIGNAYNHTPQGTVLWDRGQPIGSISWDPTGDTYIAFRGTDSLTDWLSDLDTDLVPFGSGRVSRGFLSVYQREYHLTDDGSPCVTPILWDLCISAYGAIRRPTQRTSIRRDIRRSVAAAGRATQEATPQGGATIWVSGHSLGGALATLAATDILSGDIPSFPIPIRTVLLAFGSPKVGDSGFVGAFGKVGATRAYRIHMVDDVVPQIPLPCYRHVPAKVIGLSQGGDCPLGDCPSEDIHWLHAMERYWEAVGAIEGAVGGPNR